jgi:serine/threonine protein kinase
MGVCTEKDNLAVVMEYVDGRDLESIVHDKDVVMTTAQQLLIAKGIAQGVHTHHRTQRTRTLTTRTSERSLVRFCSLLGGRVRAQA